MNKIVLEKANNGIIKKVIDNNHGGGANKYKETQVYEIEADSNKFDHVIRFFYELCEDMGIDTGNRYQNEVLNFNIEWGDKYKPTKDEIQSKINYLQLLQTELKEILKNAD